MTQNPSDPLKLEPVGVSSDGRRRYYDEEAKQKLVEACLQPGVSLAGMALKAGVNANLLRRWVSKHQEKRDGTVATDVIEGTPSAFVPVVEIGRTDAQSRQSGAQSELLPAHGESVRSSLRPPAPSRLTVEMPNGITLKLECSGQDTTLVSAMIETLGAAMFRLEAELRVYLHRDAVDFRNGINGLVILVEQSMQLDPFARAVFAFRNKRANRIKLLFYERSGFWLMMKRLEADRFVWPRRQQAVMELTSEQLHWLLEGIDIDAVRRHPSRQYRHVS